MTLPCPLEAGLPLASPEATRAGCTPFRGGGARAVAGDKGPLAKTGAIRERSRGKTGLHRASGTSEGYACVRVTRVELAATSCTGMVSYTGDARRYKSKTKLKYPSWSRVPWAESPQTRQNPSLPPEGGTFPTSRRCIKARKGRHVCSKTTNAGVYTPSRRHPLPHRPHGPPPDAPHVSSPDVGAGVGRCQARKCLHLHLGSDPSRGLVIKRCQAQPLHAREERNPAATTRHEYGCESTAQSSRLLSQMHARSTQCVPSPDVALSPPALGQQRELLIGRPVDGSNLQVLNVPELAQGTKGSQRSED